VTGWSISLREYPDPNLSHSAPYFVRGKLPFLVVVLVYLTVPKRLAMSDKPTSIDAYIAGFPKGTQEILELVRATIRQAAPEAEEKISYAIPTFTLNKEYLVYFAAFKNHIGFYPTPVGMEEFKKDLSPYKQGKGSVQFPLDQPMPLDLITKIVKYRIHKNSEKALKRNKRRSSSDEGTTVQS
jgi:uncharacterized protein YdhG (YjbR/CyaY superfamily)